MSLLILMFLFLLGRLRLRRFKPDRDEIWQDSSSSKYASIVGVGFLICGHPLRWRPWRLSAPLAAVRWMPASPPSACCHRA